MGLDRATLAVTPAAMAPAGMTSNLVNPVSRSWHVELTIGITLAPAIFLVALRIYARLGLARNLGIDDYICIVAAGFTIAFNSIVLSLLDEPGGGALGRHIWDVPALRALEYQPPAIVESALLRISNTLIKVSILAFYLRIFNPVPRLKIMIWAGLVAVIAFLIAVLIGTIILCRPQSGGNDDYPWLSIPHRCYAIVPNFTTAGTIFSVISDFYILFIPLHLLPSMKLSRKRKAAVGSVFLIGFFACLAGITNLVIRFVNYLPTELEDFTWNTIDTYISKVAETNIGLTCACMPAVSPVALGPMRRLRTLFNSWFRRTETGVQGTRGYRDLPITENPNRRDPAIPRGTITGLHTVIQEISGSRDSHEESTAMSTLPVHTGLGVSHPSLKHGSYFTTRSQSSRDKTSTVELCS
ncbi:hypothetical protein ANO14919_027290 [Xylariales sp. No.14919]|nr:hypothetical protein ANO14919_027290 [Xylariales sp. No.14919]